MTTLTKEQVEHFREPLKRQIRRDTVLHIPISDEMNAVDQLIDLALRGLAVTQRPIEWHDVSELPPVQKGDMGYYLVVNSKSRRAFGAFYLNEYLLRSDDFDCPSASVENDFTPCKTCDDGDGHPFTGWFDEKETPDGDWYSAIDVFGDFAVKMWAVPPVSPLSSLPTGGE